MEIKEEKPPWFDVKIEKLINLPREGNYEKYKLKFDKGIQTETFHFTRKKVKILNIQKVEKNYEIEKQNIQKKLENNILKLNKTKNEEKDKKKKEKIDIKIKSITTKANKKINNLNKTTICKQYQIYPTNNQKEILNKWFMECKRVYNKCVDLHNENNKYFDKGFQSTKISVFKLLYKDEKNAPYDILSDEVRIFCSNLKSARTNVSNGNQHHFDMHHKNVEKNHCIFIPKTSINENSIYKTHLGKLEGMDKINFVVENDCRLNYNKLNNKYTLLVPVNIKIKEIERKQKVVALDPGEKIFQSYFSQNRFGHIGIDMRKPILKIEKQIRKYQRILKKGINKKGEKIKNKKNIKLKINKCYKKIKDKVKNLHNKTALYLCKKYDHILIPTFETQNMVKNNISKMEIKRIFEEKGKIEGMKVLKEYDKKRRLNGRVKFVLNMLSHYKFRQHLSNKCIEYGCKMHVVTEEYTSKTCTKCGHISNNYKRREKECEKCGYKINRDINGARNILIKNIKLVLGRKSEQPSISARKENKVI